jgi:triose/dihydroxyacetone kinase / FAD-AMP lyase (cyclizing)
MLDAAVLGDVFASPNALQVQAGLQLVESPKGILIIVKAYTGDKLNFTLAAERFRFATGQPVRMVVVGDDVSIGRTKSARVGRRGLAGTVLIHKIAGAASVSGCSLDTIVDMADYAIANMGTVGVGLDACSMPGMKRQARLQLDEVEIGIGIHNEPGSRRVQPQPTLDALVADMLSAILDPSDVERNYLASTPGSATHEIVLLVNNLGGLSTLEVLAATGEAIYQLNSTYQLSPCRVYSGIYLSALNGPGFSLTILSLPKDSPHSARILHWLDAPTDALGWTCSIPGTVWADRRLARRGLDSQPAKVAPVLYSIPDIPCKFICKAKNFDHGEN